MAQTGPSSILQDKDYTPVAVYDGAVIDPVQPLIPLAGQDGTNQQAIKTDSAGRLEVVGPGTAGSPVGGVLSVQGVTGGTPLPVTSQPFTSSTRVITRVVAAAVSTLIKAANASRLALILVNDSNKPAYVHFGAGPASTTSYTYKMAPDDRLDPETFGGWDGDVYAIWFPGAGTGAMQVTELTA